MAENNEKKYIIKIKGKEVGRPKIFNFTQSLKKRTLIRNRYTNAVSATKKAE